MIQKVVDLLVPLHAVVGVVATKLFSDLVNCTKLSLLCCFLYFASQFLDEVPLVLSSTPLHFSVFDLVFLLCPLNLL